MDGVGAPARVLVVEDAEEVADVLEAVLGSTGLDVRVRTDGQTGLEEAVSWQPDIVILDLNLPRLDGLEVCRRLRSVSDSYVLMLSARTDEVDRVVGLSVGADDYVTKPFSPREIQARVQALLRRPRALGGTESPPVPSPAPEAQGPTQVRQVGPVEVDLGGREVAVGGAGVPLTKIEYDILDVLSENPRLVITRGHLRDRVWGGDWMADDHAVDVHVSNLRKKLAQAGAGQVITTVRGVGYRITPS